LFIHLTLLTHMQTTECTFRPKSQSFATSNYLYAFQKYPIASQRMTPGATPRQMDCTIFLFTGSS
ncbi:hypothetical protein, partial [Aeromonas caviae]|uniref:hypothetical protein n=1 Tax=Aeromonas caviae TaxID=648 RepID=UPI00244BC81D